MRAVNLIPGEQRQGAGSITGRSGGGALIVLGLIAGLAALVLMYGSAHHQISSQNGQVASLTALANAIQARTGRLTPYTSFVSMANQRRQTVAQLVQARFDWSHALHELGRVLPAGTALGSLHGAVGAAGQTPSSSTAATAAVGATPASSTPPGSTPVFTITGCATSQSVVAQTLQRLRLMDGASEVQLQSSSKSGSASTSSSSSSSGGGCPSSDASFSVQVLFAGLPAGPAPSVSTGTAASPAAAHSSATSKQVSLRGKGVPR
jgi:Tfp pilus assembly protein PilN